MNSKLTLALISLLLLASNTYAIKALDDCDGEKQYIKDGEYF
jgi:hypothetical protein